MSQMMKNVYKEFILARYESPLGKKHVNHFEKVNEMVVSQVEPIRNNYIPRLPEIMGDKLIHVEEAVKNKDKDTVKLKVISKKKKCNCN